MFSRQRFHSSTPSKLPYLLLPYSLSSLTILKRIVPHIPPYNCSNVYRCKDSNNPFNVIDPINFSPMPIQMQLWNIKKEKIHTMTNLHLIYPSKILPSSHCPSKKRLLLERSQSFLIALHNPASYPSLTS